MEAFYRAGQGRNPPRRTLLGTERLVSERILVPCAFQAAVEGLRISQFYWGREKWDGVGRSSSVWTGIRFIFGTILPVV